MRSGFPTTDPGADADLFAADLDREWTAADWTAAIPAGTPGLGERGGTPRYNGLNYRWLAELVAEVTAGSYAAAVRSDLLDPAGLENTWLQPTEEASDLLTVGGQTSHADIVDADGPEMPSVAFNSAWLGAGSMAADATDAALWAYQLFGGQVIDTTLVEAMEADPQPEPNIGDYALGVNVLDLGTVTLIGHAGGGMDLPYTSAVYVVLGEVPVAIAVLTPQAADHATQIFDLFMRLHELTTA